MKKLLTLAATLLAAVCVQAATTSWDWTVQNVYGIDDAGAGDEGFVTGSVQLITAGIDPSTDGMSATFDADGNAMGTVTGDTTGAFAPDTPWQAKVTVNIGGTDYTKTFDFTIPTGLSGDIQNDSGIFGGLNDTLYDGIVGSDGVLMTSAMESNGWTKGEVVPEPCSVALLALGLVALGLKRKIA